MIDERAGAADTEASGIHPRKGPPMRRIALLACALAALSAAGCVQVQLAQDKPIDINLNVNIKQEVVVRLERDVQELIESNPGIF